LTIIRSYTREAGLRNLEREIGRVCRKIARAITEGRTEPVTCTAETVREYLGPERFFSELAERTEQPASPWGSHGRPTAATSCSSSRRGWRARSRSR
jgi:ATP-dependent Lon protease